jgi:hypothetical protein
VKLLIPSAIEGYGEEMVSMNQETDSHQVLHVSMPGFWTSSLQNWRNKPQVFVSHSLWDFTADVID